MNINKLKGVIREKGYSQKKLANEIGISLQSLNAKINGRADLTLSEVINIIQILNIENPKEIFFDNCVSKKQHNQRKGA